MKSARLLANCAASLILALIATACSNGGAVPVSTVATASAGQCGTLVPRTQEGSFDLDPGYGSVAMVASRAHAGVIWSVISGPEGQELSAWSADGQKLSGLRIPDMDVSLEDIAIGSGPESGDAIYLLANTGSDDDPTVSVYRFAEPELSVTGSVASDTLTFAFDGLPRDVNGMFVDPQTGALYFVASSLDGAGVFTAEPPFDPANIGVVRQVATVSRQVGSLVSSADITPAGDGLAIATGDSVSLWSRQPGQSIVEALTASPCVVELPGFEAAGGFSFTGEANEFHTLAAGSNPMLLTQRPPTDPTAAVAGLATAPERGNLAPVILIESPRPDFTWQVGDTIGLDATILDDQEVDVRDLAWEITLDHCAPEKRCVNRSVFQHRGAGGEFVIDQIGYSLPVRFTITATYSDQREVEASAAIEIYPESITASFTSNPAGAVVTVGDETVVAPGSSQLIVGDTIVIEPQRVQPIDGVDFAFGSWSDGGDRVRQLTVQTEAVDFELDLVEASTLGPVTVTIGSPGNNSVVSGPTVIISGRAKGGFGRAIDQVKLFLRNRDRDLYWNGERWTEDWSWFDPVGQEDWSSVITLDSGRYVAIAFARDTSGGEWLQSTQRFFSVR